MLIDTRPILPTAAGLPSASSGLILAVTFSAAPLRDSVCRDERAWKEAERAGAKSAPRPVADWNARWSRRLPGKQIAVNIVSVKQMSFREIKRREAQSRMAAVRKARHSPRVATALQRRASLVGDGAKWRITNFLEVARAMARQWR